MASSLSRVPRDTQILIFKNRDFRGNLRNFKVRKLSVERALIWLKDNNPIYCDVSIDWEILDSLPVDGVPEGVIIETCATVKEEKEADALAQ